jgi:subtilisin family serine protease
MGVLKAWEIMADSGSEVREVTVAIIDTGVDYTHPELADKMWVNNGEIADDGMDNDGNGYTDDINGWDFYNNDASICHYEYSKQHNKMPLLAETGICKIPVFYIKKFLLAERSISVNTHCLENFFKGCLSRLLKFLEY